MQIVFIILATLGSLAIMVGFFIFFKGVVKQVQGFEDTRYGVIGIIGGISLIGLGIVSIFGVNDYQKTLRNNELYAKVESGYTAYLDGVETDINNLDIDQYSIKYDDESKKVLMSEKEDRRNVFVYVPFIYSN